MQFIPGTWRTVGVDANGDGVKNPQNIADAATATAVYLCSGPGDLTHRLGPALRRPALQPQRAYVQQVIAIAAGYRGGYSVVPAQALSAEQRNGSPYLPSGASPRRAPAPRQCGPAAASKRSPQPAAGPAPRTGTDGGSGRAPARARPAPPPRRQTTATARRPGVVVGGPSAAHRSALVTEPLDGRHDRPRRPDDAPRPATTCHRRRPRPARPAPSWASCTLGDVCHSQRWAPSPRRAGACTPSRVRGRSRPCPVADQAGDHRDGHDEHEHGDGDPAAEERRHRAASGDRPRTPGRGSVGS